MQLRLIYLFFLLSLLSIQADAQEYNFINYNVQEGLPQSQVYDIFQDSKSYLWMATQGGGVAFFDGNSFEVLSTRDGLPSNYVHTIYEDVDNTLWLGTKTGLCSYKHPNITWSEKSEQIIYSIIAKTDSTLWLGTQAGIYRFNKRQRTSQKLTLARLLDVSRINDFLQIGQEIWMATSRGIYIATDKGIRQIGFKEGLLSEDIKSLAKDKNGNIWVVQFAGGVSCIEPKSKEILASFDQANINRGQHVFIDAQDQKWISTQNRGVSIYNELDSTWQIINEQKGLAHNNVQAVFQDIWGNKWIATSGGGVHKFLGQYFAHFTSDNGLNGNRIYAIKEDSKGKMWLSVDNEGVSTIDSTGIRTNVDSAYIRSKCNHVFEDKEERIWLSTAGGGLVLKDSSKFWVFKEEQGLPSNWIKTTIQDTLGNIWIGTYANGLARISGIDTFRINIAGQNQLPIDSTQTDSVKIDTVLTPIWVIDSIGLQLQSFGLKQGLPDLFITALAQDPTGKIWFATKQGAIGFIENNLITSFAQRAGLPKVAIRSIAFDSLQNIWIGTAGEGVFQATYTAENVQFEKIASSEKLSSENIYLLIFDEEANLWAGSEVGVDKIIFNASGIVVDIQHFGKNEGFLGIETCHNAATLDRKGNLWFGTLNGLSRHKPGRTQVSVSAPKIHFQGINLMYKSITDSDYAAYLNTSDSLISKSTFPYNKNNIGFKFNAINIDYPNDFAYSWRLKGLDENWSDLSKSNAVNYTNLSAGEYQFQVKAIGKSGLSSKTISTSFIITPAFWQQTWFQLLALALLGFLTYIFVRFRIAKIEKREAGKRAKLELKNELLELEQKALQLQMNPHFIFNALNSIQSLVVNQKTEVARTQIQTFATLMRGILSNSKKTRINLQEEYLTLDKYLKMERFCQAFDFDYEIILPTAYDPEEIEIPPMMIQPFVENAVFHGISTLPRKGKITVTFTVKGERLKCTIVDNGVGREQAKAAKHKQEKGHQSTAIAVTKQRLQALSKGQIKDYFLITDVLSSDGKVEGTQVTLVVPLEMNF